MQNSSDILVDPYTYHYWNVSRVCRTTAIPISNPQPGFSRDNGPVKVHPGEYSTDLVRDKALDYLSEGAKAADESGRPFFVGIAPIAPHSCSSMTHLTSTPGSILTCRDRKAAS
jgi:N-acetylglucosamine-6-sulfatase